MRPWEELFAGALFDFGLSSRQIDDPARGISFMLDGPLDQRMDPTSGEPLSERLARADESEVAAALREYGDVRGAHRLAGAIVAAARAGGLGTTRALALLVGRVLGDSRPKSLAPVFQALRIWINDEMTDIDSALAWLPGAMRDGGVVVTLAYHSGEDRRVKHALRGVPRVSTSRRLPVMDDEKAALPWEELTRKVVVPSIEEQKSNPRAQRAAQGIPEEVAMTKDWRRTAPSWRISDAKSFRWELALAALALLGGLLLEVWQNSTVQSLSVQVGRVTTELQGANARLAWTRSQLDRASSRAALGPMASAAGLRPVDPAQIVSLPEEYLLPAGPRERARGQGTLLASAGRALQSLVPDAAARGRQLN